MRTSPLGTQRRLRRAPILLLAALMAVAVLAPACSDDDGGEGSTPTTTSPTTGSGDPDDGTTTGPEETTTSEVETTEADGPGGEEGTPLTDEQVAGELERLYGAYVAAFESARERGGLDERFRGDLARIFLPELLENEITGIESIGGLGALVDDPGAIPIDDVAVEISAPTCASGSAVFDLRPLVGEAAPGPLTRFFKLELSDAQTGWRFSALGSTEAGETFAGASCEDG